MINFLLFRLSALPRILDSLSPEFAICSHFERPNCLSFKAKSFWRTKTTEVVGDKSNTWSSFWMISLSLGRDFAPNRWMDRDAVWNRIGLKRKVYKRLFTHYRFIWDDYSDMSKETFHCRCTRLITATIIYLTLLCVEMLWFCRPENFWRREIHSWVWQVCPSALSLLARQRTLWKEEFRWKWVHSTIPGPWKAIPNKKIGFPKKQQPTSPLSGPVVKCKI